MINKFEKIINCVFIKELLPECYCTNPTSMTIPKMLAFCGGDYTKCPIYIYKVG